MTVLAINIQSIVISYTLQLKFGVEMAKWSIFCCGIILFCGVLFSCDLVESGKFTDILCRCGCGDDPEPAVKPVAHPPAHPPADPPAHRFSENLEIFKGKEDV